MYAELTQWKSVRSMDKKPCDNKLLKTIMSRITTMSEAETALNGVNISIRDMGGNIRPVSAILEQLAGQWTTLSDEQRQNLGVTLAGRYQLSRFLALMNNFSIATDATTMALDSQGSSMREQAKYADSMEARLNRLDTAWNKVVLSAGEAVVTDSFVSIVETLNDLATVSSKAIDTFGLLSGVFGTLGIATVLLSTRFRTFTTSLIFGTQGMTRAQLASAGLTAGMTRLGIATLGASTALRGLLVATGVGAVFAVVGIAIERLISAYSNARQKQEEFEESQQKNIAALTENKQQTEELIASYKKLSAQKDSGNWDNDKEKEYLKIQQQLGEIYPSLISQLDATGQYHLINADNIDKEVAKTKELLELKKEEIRLNALQTFEDNIGDREGFLGLEKRIEAKEKQLQDMANHDFKQTYVNKVKQELLQLENELAQSSLKINDEVLKVAEAYNKLDIDPTIKKNVQDFLYSLDLTNLNANQLEDYSIKVSTLTDELQKAYAAGDGKGFDNARDSLISYAEKMGATEAQAGSLDISFDKVKEAADRLKDATYAGADGMGAVDAGMEGASESADKLAEAYDGAISNISTLNGIINELNENHSVSADTVGDIMEKYPHLLAYLNDESKMRQKVMEQITQEEKVAKQAMLGKLQYNQTFYKASIEANTKQVQTFQKAYGVDLKAFKSLGEAKVAVENKVLGAIAGAWESHTQRLMTMTRVAAMTGNPMMQGIGVALGALKDQATKVTADFNDIFLDQVDVITGSSIATNGLKDATEKSSKEYESATYVSDRFRASLEKLNLELEKQRAIQAKFPKHSSEYQNALKKEINLMERKKDLLQAQSKELDRQIKSGKIQQTGIIKSNNSSYSGKYSSEINQAATKYGVDPNLIAAIIQAESSFNPNARSGVGAQGLMQLMPATARELGVKNAFNPYQNIMGGTKYISQLIDKFGGNIKQALWAYNAGAGNVSKILSSGSNTWTGVKAYADKILTEFNKTNQTVSTASQGIADYYLNNFRQTSKYGSQEAFRSSPHKGLDLANGKQGDPVKALRGGKVITASYSKSAGYWVVVQQDDGTVAKYMHMQKGLNVKAGQNISAGQQLGKVGNTGQSTGAHLHLQIEQNGKTIDPNKYLQGLASGQAAAEQMQSVDEAKSELIQLQQDALAIEAEMQELYMALVESKLAGFDRVKNSYVDDLSKIDLIQRREITTSKEWINQQLKKESIIRKQIDQDKKAVKFLKDQIKANKDLNAAQKSLLEDQLVNRYQELYSLEQQLLDERISMADQVVDTYKKSLEAQKEASLNAIDELINGINKEAEENDYKKKLENAQKDRQEILDEIAKLSIDDSFAAKKRIAELTKQLQEQDESIFEMQEDKAREDRIDNLNSEKEKVESDYENLLNDERKFAQMRSDIINGNSAQIKKDLDKFYTNIKSNTNILGKALSENLIDLINQANRYLNGKDYKPIKVAQAKDGGLLPNWGSNGKSMVVHEGELISSKPDTQALFKVTDLAKSLLTKLPTLPKIPSIIPNMNTSGENNITINLRIDNLSGTKNDANFLLNEVVKGAEKFGVKFTR